MTALSFLLHDDARALHNFRLAYVLSGLLQRTPLPPFAFGCDALAPLTNRTGVRDGPLFDLAPGFRLQQNTLRVRAYGVAAQALRHFVQPRCAPQKNKRYNKIITEKKLDLNYESFIVETFGAFASDTWKFINTVCDPNTHPKANDEYSPWNNPAPLRAFTLASGFANQRGNATMLIQANNRRRAARATRRHASR